MKYCAFCGAQLNEIAKFCTNCGQAVASDANNSLDDHDNPNDFPDQKNFIQRHRVVVAVFAALLLLLTVLGIHLSNSDSGDLTDCNSLANSVIKLSSNSKYLVAVVDITDPTNIALPANLSKPNWTTQLSCQGEATLSTGISQQEDFELVTDPNGKNFAEWQPASLNN